MKRKHPPTYFHIINEKFDREEDGSVGFPNGMVLDAETKKVRPPIPFPKTRKTRP